MLVMLQFVNLRKFTNVENLMTNAAVADSQGNKLYYIFKTYSADSI